MDANMTPPEQEFSGTEKSVFMEDIRSTIIDLTDALVAAEKEFVTDDSSFEEVRKYVTLRSYFRKLIILTNHKIGDEDFLNKCISWVNSPVKSNKKERIKDTKAAGDLIITYMGILTDVGIIDIHGNSFSNKYPFPEIVYENIGVIDKKYLSPFDLGVIEFIKDHFEKERNKK